MFRARHIHWYPFAWQWCRQELINHALHLSAVRRTRCTVTWFTDGSAWDLCKHCRGHPNTRVMMRCDYSVCTHRLYLLNEAVILCAIVPTGPYSSVHGFPTARLHFCNSCFATIASFPLLSFKTSPFLPHLHRPLCSHLLPLSYEAHTPSSSVPYMPLPLIYYALRRRGVSSDTAIRPSVRLSVPA